RNTADVQVEIHNKSQEFFELYNEIVTDDAYKIKCTWSGGGGTMNRRVCAAGYLVREMKDSRSCGAAGGYRRPSREYLDARQELFNRAIVEALRERPYLMVLAEEINALKEEESRLSGRTRFLERQAERQRRREFLDSEILRAASDRAARRPG